MTAALATILQVQDLRFAYPDQSPIVDAWSARIDAGITLLHGDTGSGKSTLLRVLAGAEPAQGVLALCGHRLDTHPQAYRREVFWPSPDDDSHQALTPREHAEAVAEGTSFDAAAWQRHADGFGLGPHLHKSLFMLSTGSRRKSLLAAALASGRALTLLDEPAAALDGASIAYLMRVLGECSAAHDRAIVVASSDTLGDLPLAGCFTLPLR